MAKIPGKGTTKTPAPIKPVPAKPAGVGAKAMNLPPGVKTEIRRVIREEVAKAGKKR